MAFNNKNYFQRRTKPRGPVTNYKIREYSLSKVPILLICGKKEVKNKSITIRRLGSDKQETLSLDKAIKKISQKNKFPIN